MWEPTNGPESNGPSNNEPVHDDPPQVIDHRSTPRGVMPRHLQQWVLVGTALVMVGIMTLSGPPVKPRAAATVSTSTMAIDANQQRIEEYQRRIQEEANRLATERAKLELTKQTFTTNADKSAEILSPHGAGGQDSEARPHVEANERSRNDRALFADNVAFLKSGVPPALPVPPARPAQSDQAPLPAPVALSSEPRKFRLSEGSIIKTVLTNRLEGSFAGPVNSLVSVPVYASDHQHLLIPTGARALGEARPVNTFGQTRLAVAFHRLVLPNGAHIDLNQFHGLNQIGDVGLHDQVNHHYGQLFGVSLAIGAIGGLASVNTRAGLGATAGDVYRQGVSTSAAESSLRILDRFLNILPTVVIREGHRIKVYLTNDLELPAYEGGRQ
jgi:type IV secretory pathway VirB10-like protein